MRSTFVVLVLSLLSAGTAAARDLPDYYPEDLLRRAGQLDAVYFDQNRIVIDDVPYALSLDVVVHAPTSYSVARTRLKPGTMVAFKVGSNRTITAVWLLPLGFDAEARR